MGQHAFSQSFDMSVLANYQSLWGGVSAAIQADGWTKTADTGQTDPSGATLPANDAQTVFELFQSPGMLTPIYVKISYEKKATNEPQFTVRCGTGTDGAGNLTGILTTARTCRANRSAAAHGYVSGGEGWLMLSLCPIETDTSGAWFLIDRSVDGTETYTNDYFTQVTGTTGSDAQQESKMLSGGVQPPTQVEIISPRPRPTGGTGTWIIDVFLSSPLMLPIVRGGQAQHSPNLAVHTGAVTDFAPDTVTILPVYGANHSYLVSGFALPGSVVTRPMLRYE